MADTRQKADDFETSGQTAERELTIHSSSENSIAVNASDQEDPLLAAERQLNLELRLRQIEHNLTAIGAALEGHAAWLKGIEHGLADLSTAHTAQLGDIGRWLTATTHQVSALSTSPVIPSVGLQAIGPKVQRVDDRIKQARINQVWTVVRWLQQAPVESNMLISVVIPTYGRTAYLERAIASVLAQRHTNFELVVVDDGSKDDTAQRLAAITDPRIRILRTTGVGASAARNIGLQAAQGEVIAHLDDDNLMDPGWLRAVAWGFTRWPDTELLYGARIIEDGLAMDGLPSGAFPELEWQPFDRARLEHSNYIDMNVIAHRAGLPEAHFDPLMTFSIEWDMLLRLTARRAPLELPVIACLYSSYAPDRLSKRPGYLRETQILRARAHTTRPLRILCYNALFPLLSETYIEEEMLALEAAGAVIAFASFAQSVSPYPVRQPVFSSLEEAIASHDPDVIVIYWTSHVLGALEFLERTGRPFALRVHSFDFDIDHVSKIREHPSCVGVWAFPHQAALVAGAHELVPIFTTHTKMPEPLANRHVVASVSAGLPKKDWPLLFDAMDRLSEFERVIVLARSNGFEELPGYVSQLAASLQPPPLVRVNVPRAEVFKLLARTSVLIYTVTPDMPLGMPMSIIEALYAGACVITPDRPEMQAMCREGFRPYRHAADIASHVREVMAGGPHIEEERRQNRKRAVEHFCGQELGQRFHTELSAALTAWRLQCQLA